MSNIKTYNDCECVKETDKALLVSKTSGLKAWIPHWVIHKSSEIQKNGDTGNLKISASWSIYVVWQLKPKVLKKQQLKIKEKEHGHSVISQLNYRKTATGAHGYGYRKNPNDTVQAEKQQKKKPRRRGKRKK